MPPRLVRIVAPHFVAGLVTDGTVYIAAPILRYLVGWDDESVRAYLISKGWTWTSTVIPPEP